MTCAPEREPDTAFSRIRGPSAARHRHRGAKFRCPHLYNTPRLRFRSPKVGTHSLLFSGPKAEATTLRETLRSAMYTHTHIGHALIAHESLRERLPMISAHAAAVDPAHKPSCTNQQAQGRCSPRHTHTHPFHKKRPTFRECSAHRGSVPKATRRAGWAKTQTRKFGRDMLYEACPRGVGVQPFFILKLRLFLGHVGTRAVFFSASSPPVPFLCYS